MNCVYDRKTLFKEDHDPSKYLKSNFKFLKWRVTIFTSSLLKSTASALVVDGGSVVSFVFATFSLALLFSWNKTEFSSVRDQGLKVVPS